MAAPLAGAGWRPLLRAAATSGTVMAAGDVLCQALRARAAGRDLSLDLSETRRFALVGATLHGPFFLHAFRWLDRVCGPSATLRQAAAKAALGQVTVFPTYVAAFFAYVGALEGLGPGACAAKVAAAAPQTLATGTLFWPVVNVVNFLYVASSARVAYVNAAGLFWNAFLSYENATRGQVEQQAAARGKSKGR